MGNTTGSTYSDVRHQITIPGTSFCAVVHPDRVDVEKLVKKLGTSATIYISPEILTPFGNANTKDFVARAQGWWDAAEKARQSVRQCALIQSGSMQRPEAAVAAQIAGHGVAAQPSPSTRGNRWKDGRLA